jgi:ribonucleoside-triphosphate reductase (thioredoxin)
MCSEPDYLDYRAKGGNPCLEQTLESYEMCCLVETFPSRHETKEDFLQTLKIALTYAKTVTLGPTHWPQSNAIMLRNRRIGTSLSGIAQFIANNGLHTLKDWCEDGYFHLKRCDESLSEKFGIPLSIKLTCIKPSGTVSLLAGSTPGMHFPESRFYIRRVRISNTSELLEPIRQAGYKIEKTVGNEESSVVVEFPIDTGDGGPRNCLYSLSSLSLPSPVVRVLDSVTMWEQLGLAAFLQRYWADNQVILHLLSFKPSK